MKNILVIGASGDIGSEICQSLACEDNQLILHYHQNSHQMQMIANSLPEDKVLQIVQADLRKVSEINKLCHDINYHVHGIVFVSGVAQIGLFQDANDDVMDTMMTLHIKAPWIITRHFLPHMIQNRQGHIVFITSIWGEVGASHEVIYSSVKGAQNSFVKALAKEVGPSGVNVNAVSPGLIDTKMNQQLEAIDKEGLINEIPLKRIGLTTDVANLVEFLLSSKASYIQGQVIRISGGW